MFRRKFHRHSFSKGTEKRKSPFNEDFWGQYLVGYSKMTSGEHIKTLSPNTKKYQANSSSVQALKKYFETLKLEVPSTHQVIAVLRSPFTQGDLIKSFHLIRFFQLGGQGLFLTNTGYDKFKRQITYVGAENWESVMCYFDALLFAMFAKLESFEPMLFTPPRAENILVDQLASLMRVYVSMMRSGNLITTDITMRICEVLAKLGFTEAMSHKQQDSAALFQSLTDILSMPMLTFKIDIQHGGKFNKEDDQKYTQERILYVSIPDDEEINLQAENSDMQKNSKSSTDPECILLEECLEHYFNNSISVKRELERRATIDSARCGSINEQDSRSEATVPDGTQASENGHGRSSHLGKVEVLGDLPEGARSTDNNKHSDECKTKVLVISRQRSSTLSIWSQQLKEDPTSNQKEVSLPAWMFLRLLPFYADDNNSSIARSSNDLIRRRPILPICLKRYSFNQTNAKANKSTKKIIIPAVINLPSFVTDEHDEDISGDFRLVLESAVCHRGTSVSLGHFISVVKRDTTKEALKKEGGENAIWYLYDDMKKLSRVVEKTFKEIFDNEWPYILFYRLDPNEGVADSSAKKNKDQPSDGHFAKPFVKPEGFREKFWTDNENSFLSPSLDLNLNDLSILQNTTLSGHARNTSEVSSTSSTPIPEISPLDSKFVDIRDKYFWYCVNDRNDYYKEMPTILLNDSSELSGSGDLNEVMFQSSYNSELSTVSSVANFNAMTEPLVSNEEFGEADYKGNSNSEKNIRKEKSSNIEKMNDFINKSISNHQSSKDSTSKEAEGSTPNEEQRLKKKSYRKMKQKRDEYRREKCTVM